MIRKLLKKIKIPLLILLFILTIEAMALKNVIPPTDLIFDALVNGVEKHGLVLVAPLSFVENIVGINSYFPGSIVILTAMTLTAGNPIKALLTYLTIYSFAFLAYHVNYFIGIYYYNKEGKSVNSKLAPNKLGSSSLWIQFLSTFWHPHFAALTCIYVGSKGYKYSEIFKYMMVSSFVWNTFWGITMYKIGLAANASLNFKWLMYIFLVGWILIDSCRFYKNVRKSSKH